MKVTTVNLSNAPVQVCFAGQLLWVEFTTEALGAVCKLLLECVAPKAVRQYRARAKAEAKATAEASTTKGAESVKGTIVWNATHSCWEIMFIDAEGSRKLCRRGLKVARLARNGEPLDADEVARSAGQGHIQ